MGEHAANLRRRQRQSASKMDATIRRVKLRRFQVPRVLQNLGQTDVLLQPQNGYLDGPNLATGEDVYLYPPTPPLQSEVAPIFLLLVLQMLLSTAVTTGLPFPTTGNSARLYPLAEWQGSSLQCPVLPNTIMFKTDLAIFQIPKLNCPALFRHLAIRHQTKPLCKANFTPQSKALALSYTPKLQSKANYGNTFHRKFSWHGKINSFKPLAVTINCLPKRQCKSSTFSHKAIQKGSFSQRFQPNFKCRMPKLLLKIQVEGIIPNSGHDYGPWRKSKRHKHFCLFLQNKANSILKLFCKLTNSKSKLALLSRRFKHNIKSKYKL